MYQPLCVLLPHPRFSVQEKQAKVAGNQVETLVVAVPRFSGFTTCFLFFIMLVPSRMGDKTLKSVIMNVVGFAG